MDERITGITSALKHVADDARSTFGNLSPEQLNWKPAEKSWSVGQCLEHIIKTNEAFYPEFEKLANGTRKNSFFESYSPFTGFLGRFLIKAVSDDSKKAKAPSKKIVPPSDTSPDIVDRFASHIDNVTRTVESCAAVDRQKTVLTSPFLDVAPDLCVDVDGVQIQQVLINLITNALEAMEGCATRKIGIAARLRAGMVEISVTDSGPGLAASIRETLFEPFVSTKQHGMGVGLSICRTIVERHGGRIEASAGLPTRIAICLPAQAQDARAAA